MRRSAGRDVWSISSLWWLGVNSWRLRMRRRRHGCRVDMRWCHRLYAGLRLRLRQMPWRLSLVARKSRVHGRSIGHALRWRSWLRQAALRPLRKYGSAPLRGNVSTGPHAWLLALATMFSMWQARLCNSATVDRFFCFSSRNARRCIRRMGYCWANFFGHMARFSLSATSGSNALLRPQHTPQGGRWRDAGGRQQSFLRQIGWPRARQFIALPLAQLLRSLRISRTMPAAVNHRLLQRLTHPGGQPMGGVSADGWRGDNELVLLDAERTARAMGRPATWTALEPVAAETLIIMPQRQPANLITA
jgi:hypothetical protein